MRASLLCALCALGAAVPAPIKDTVLTMSPQSADRDHHQVASSTIHPPEGSSDKVAVDQSNKTISTASVAACTDVSGRQPASPFCYNDNTNRRCDSLYSTQTTTKTNRAGVLVTAGDIFECYTDGTRCKGRYTSKPACGITARAYNNNNGYGPFDARYMVLEWRSTPTFVHAMAKAANGTRITPRSYISYSHAHTLACTGAAPRATGNSLSWGLDVAPRGWCGFDTSQIEYGKKGVLAHDLRGMSVWADLGEIVSLTGVESDAWGQVSPRGPVLHPGSQFTAPQFTAKYSTDNATWFWY